MAPLPSPALVGVDGLYCTGEESLRLTSWNSAASVRLALGGRFLQVGRERPQSINELHTPLTTRAANVTDHALGEGWLQGVTVIASSGTPLTGACFVRVDLVRGRGASATILQTLLQGYVTSSQRRAWPGSEIESSLDGPGLLRSITGTDPAANTEIQETVPTGAQWTLLSMRAALVTDVNAANREVALTVDDGAAIYAEFASGAAQAASLTRQYTFSPAGLRGAAAVGTSHMVAIAPLALPAGHRINTVTTNRQAGDNWGAPQLLVIEWLEPTA